MCIILREHTQLILDARTIPRSSAVNNAGKKRGVIKSFAKAPVNFFVGVKDKTIHLLTNLLHPGRNIQIRKAFRLGIPLLAGKHRRINRSNVDSRGSAGLHSAGRDAPLYELTCDMIRAPLTNPAANQLPAADE